MKRKDDNVQMNAFTNKCRQLGLKMTPQRAAIYKILLGSKNHPYADTIYKKVRKIFPHISFDTVNRTLSTFSKMGVIRVVEGYGDPKRFDPNTHSHHHFRCMECNSITDFCSKSWDCLTIPGNIQKQYTIHNKKVLLEGVCNKCRTK